VTGRLRDDADFRRFWLSRVISLAGTAVTYVALPVLVYALTHSPLVTALVAAFEALPYVFLGLVAGALADRWDRKRLLVTCDVLSGLVVGSVPLADAFGALTVGQVLACAALLPTLFVFFDAAQFGAVPALVGRDRIAQANSAVFGADSLLQVVVPLAAGVLLAVLTPSELLGVDALSFVGSALLVRALVRPLSDPARERRPVDIVSLRADVIEGLRFLRDEPRVRAMTLVGALQAVAGGAFVGQLVVWADRSLDVRAGDPRLGVLYGGWGVGALAVSVVMPRLVRRWTAAGVTLRALPVSALLGVAVALAPDWVSATGLIAAWGAAYMLVVVNAITFRQEITPEPLMSRVGAAGRMLSFGVGWPVGSLLGGSVASWLGPVAGMLAGCAVLWVGVVVAWSSPLRTVAGKPLAARG
jgi:MFS family permease